jgi:hypothetical protein
VHIEIVIAFDATEIKPVGKIKGGGPGLPASFGFPFRGKIGQPDGGRLTGRVLACPLKPTHPKKVSRISKKIQ